MILSHRAKRVESDLFLTVIRLEFSVCYKAVLKKELGGTFVNDFASFFLPKKILCKLNFVVYTQCSIQKSAESERIIIQL